MTTPITPGIDSVQAHVSAADETFFNDALETFRLALEKLVTEHQVANFPRAALLTDIKIELEVGPKYVRVVRAEYVSVAGVTDTGRRTNASAHAFVDRTNGDILKASDWSAPDKKNPRGNIFAADPLVGVTVYGTVYLRR